MLSILHGVLAMCVHVNFSERAVVQRMPIYCVHARIGTVAIQAFRVFADR